MGVKDGTLNVMKARTFIASATSLADLGRKLNAATDSVSNHDGEVLSVGYQLMHGRMTVTHNAVVLYQVPSNRARTCADAIAKGTA